MRKVLLVAYHFPPVAGSSGVQRTLRLAQYLPEYGWKPVVLTVDPSAYEWIDDSSLTEIPQDCEVIRTPCLDARKHLSVRGRYPRFVALPDRWASWRLWAVRRGLRLVRHHGIDALWSTYPIATAHQIGAAIARRSRKPWVADFRDPMAQDGYPRDTERWKSYKRIEAEAAARASMLTFASPSARETYVERYREVPDDKFHLVENGFDESSFDGLRPRSGAQPLTRTPVLLHSGIVYPLERDPRALFAALGKLASQGRIMPGDFVLRFRAPVHDAMLEKLARAHRVESFVEIRPPIPYREALQEMFDADALVAMQGASCNEQIPAKVYEYLRARKPVLGLADPNGDTGRLLASTGFDFVVPLEATERIEAALPRFLAGLAAGTLFRPSVQAIERYSRKALTGRFAALFDEAVRRSAASALTGARASQ